MLRPGHTQCLSCGVPGLRPLCVMQQRGVPHGASGHDVGYDYRLLSECSGCGRGQLESFSHDCWSHDEDWDMYWWYLLPPADVAALKNLLRDGCPAPMDGACACALHGPLRSSVERIYGGISHRTHPGGAPQAAAMRLVLDPESGARLRLDG